MLKRYFIEMAYNGTAYHGWQLQPNAITVQAILEDALQLITGNHIATTGQGRTDTGVHARRFFVHFDSDFNFLDDKMVRKLNGILPKDIAIFNIKEVNPGAHARFDAISRTYEYHLHFRKDPFLDHFSTFWHRPVDFNKITEASKILLKYQDFACFSKTGAQAKTSICNISQAGWQLLEHKAVFTITADRFLRNMVRAIVGSLLEIGEGKHEVYYMHHLIASGDRRNAGQSVPPEGLFLVDVAYKSDIWIK